MPRRDAISIHMDWAKILIYSFTFAPLYFFLGGGGGGGGQSCMSCCLQDLAFTQSQETGLMCEESEWSWPRLKEASLF